ncbi:MAG: DNA topoisomerase IB [Rhodospirillaceae bacterium]|nr:DNA topoisomerase IB [Rhodospirillaceae bacterium]
MQPASARARLLLSRPGWALDPLQRAPAEIEALAIPPAWKSVWISPRANGHILATGRDERGRKQYIYHPAWIDERERAKFNRVLAFGRVLQDIREAVDRDMRRRTLAKGRVVATVVNLLETTLIRIGNEDYARNNKSYGLTTLKNRHVDVEGSRLRFRFKGKSGREVDLDIRDRRLARSVREIQQLPGQPIFQYLDEDGDRARGLGAERVRRVRQRRRRQAQHRPRDQNGRAPPRQHADRMPCQLRSPRSPERLSRWHAGPGAAGPDRAAADRGAAALEARGSRRARLSAQAPLRDRCRLRAQASTGPVQGLRCHGVNVLMSFRASLSRLRALLRSSELDRHQRVPSRRTLGRRLCSTPPP